MKKHFFTLFFICLAFFAKAQNEAFLQFSQGFSWFNYSDSENIDDDLIESEVNSGFGTGYIVNLSKISIRSEVNFSNFGAKSSYNNEILQWNLHYLHLNTNVGYTLKLPVFQPYVYGGFYVGYLYKANQTMGVQYVNLKKSGDIKPMDFGVNLIYGVNGQFAETIGVFFEMRNTIGLAQIESDSAQKLNNRAFSMHVGIKMTLNKKEK